MSATAKLGPWPLGIDNVSKINSLKKDQNGRIVAVRDAFNVDIDRDGKPTRRRGGVLTVPLSGLHSVWSGNSVAFGVSASGLYRIAGNTATFIAPLNSDDPCDYTELNGTVVVSNRTTLIQVNPSGWRNVGVPNAPTPGADADPDGGLHAGRYSVAIAFLRGDEEGALSGIRAVTLTEGQGIRLTLPTTDPEATGIRVFRTELGGSVLFRCTDMPLGMPSYLIGGDPLGTDPAAMYRTRMMPGEFVTYWRGRLLVARGKTIFFSDPLAYGRTSLRHNFFQHTHRITMLVGTEGGVFVGSSDGVAFLRGTKPKEWAPTFTSGRPPVKRCVTIMDGENINPDLGQNGKQVAVWLADNGFVLGMEDGSIVAAQANRLRIPLALSGSLVVNDRRATAVTS